MSEKEQTSIRETYRLLAAATRATWAVIDGPEEQKEHFANICVLDLLAHLRYEGSPEVQAVFARRAAPTNVAKLKRIVVFPAGGLAPESLTNVREVSWSVDSQELTVRWHSPAFVPDAKNVADDTEVAREAEDITTVFLNPLMIHTVFEPEV